LPEGAFQVISLLPAVGGTIMTVDYAALHEENRLEYGRAIGRIGKRLLEDRYDKRTHFIYELLQNAEDALRRRTSWAGSRTVTFSLRKDELRISHYGAPFDANDVKGICGIDESTKGVNSIGRFGIGFKSVYAFTARPEVHSGTEAFSIAEYVLPSAVKALKRHPDETLIVLPLKPDDHAAFQEIAEGLRSLGSEALLFLKQVEEIVWSVDGQGAGSYRRTTGGGSIREVVLENTSGLEISRSEYLLFSRDAENGGVVVGQVELAFSVETQDGQRAIQPLPDARLVVFFPTVLPTYTGFLVQGPYQTTPSRDNIPAEEPWNRKLAALTSELLADSLGHLRDNGLLSVATLRALPLDRSKFSGLFAPLYERTAEAFQTERLLPTATDRFVKASELRLARAQDVRDLLGPRNLAALLGVASNVYWTAPEITVDRAPQLRSYLMQELKVVELTVEQVLARMTDEFLTEQSDTWMIKFYRLLESQPALLRSNRGQALGLFRLEDGTHVPLMRHGIRQVFLSSGQKTGFPTLRSSLQNSQTRKFLELAKLTEPDPVDDVIHHLLPGYRKTAVDTGNYADDIGRMLRAFQTDSQALKEKLITELRTANIVIAKDAATKKTFICNPPAVYLGAARLTNLFDGVEGVYLVDGSRECLRGEPVREMLEASGSTRILRTVICQCDLSETEKEAVRRAAGWERASTDHPIQDVDIDGLDALLSFLPSLDPEQRAPRARLLWDALSEFVERRGANILSVTYNWTYMAPRSASVDARFLRRLNAAAWIPDTAGALRRPSEVLFEDLGWPDHPILQSRIAFKPPAIAALAREAGFDAGLLDELRRLGLMSVEQLRERLGPEADASSADGGGTDNDDGSDEERSDGRANGDEDDRSHGVASNDGGNSWSGSGGTGGQASGGGGQGQESGNGSSSGQGSGVGVSQGGRQGGPGEGSGRGEFISYVGTHPEGEEDDPNSPAHKERMELENAAIAFILELEPMLERMPVGNKGYDLIEKKGPTELPRLIEVKAMRGTLKDRPATLSSAQIDEARSSGERFWLYVVERAGTSSPRLLKIQNPYGRAGTFTFDHGWEAIAAVVDTSARIAAE